MRALGFALFALCFVSPAIAQWQPPPTCAGTSSGAPFGVTGVPNDDSYTTSVGVHTIASNQYRTTITFLNVPSTCTGGIYVSGTSTTANATLGSAWLQAGTQLFSFPINVIGKGPVTVYSATAGCGITIWEC